MKRVLAVLAVGLAATVTINVRGVAGARGVEGAPGAQAAGDAVTIDQVLGKYVEALGGQSAVEKLTSLVMKGSVENPGTGETGTMEVYKKAPDKGFLVMVIPSSGPASRGYNGKTGWYVDPDEGLKDVAAAELPALKRKFDIYREIRLKLLYPKMQLRGKEKLDGRDAYVVEATADDGTSEKMYFDAQTGLLVRNDAPYVTEDGNSYLQTVFEDYREVSGVKLPFVWRQSSPDFDYVIKFAQIQNNVPVDDSKFEKPKM